jgi:tetratricopeptide (TPR) repeat protein
MALRIRHTALPLLGLVLLVMVMACGGTQTAVPQTPEPSQTKAAPTAIPMIAIQDVSVTGFKFGEKLPSDFDGRMEEAGKLYNKAGETLQKVVIEFGEPIPVGPEEYVNFRASIENLDTSIGMWQDLLSELNESQQENKTEVNDVTAFLIEAMWQKWLAYWVINDFEGQIAILEDIVDFGEMAWLTNPPCPSDKYMQEWCFQSSAYRNPYLNRVYALEDLGKYDEALENYLKGMEIESRTPDPITISNMKWVAIKEKPAGIAIQTIHNLLREIKFLINPSDDSERTTCWALTKSIYYNLGELYEAKHDGGEIWIVNLITTDTTSGYDFPEVFKHYPATTPYSWKVDVSSLQVQSNHSNGICHAD